MGMKEVKLIDFDWAGVQGQIQYPPLISSTIGWPEGVGPLALIEYHHDCKMLEQLFS